MASLFSYSFCSFKRLNLLIEFICSSSSCAVRDTGISAFLIFCRSYYLMTLLLAYACSEVSSCSLKPAFSLSLSRSIASSYFSLRAYSFCNGVKSRSSPSFSTSLITVGDLREYFSALPDRSRVSVLCWCYRSPGPFDGELFLPLSMLVLRLYLSAYTSMMDDFFLSKVVAFAFDSP